MRPDYHDQGAAMNRQDLTTKLLGTTLCAGMAFASSGCFQRHDTAFFERGDVEIDVPHEMVARSSGEVGDVYRLIRWTAVDVNGFVTALVEGMANIVDFLDRRRPTSTDGDWRIYGPFDDDEGRDAAWAIKIAGDDDNGRFEVLVGSRGQTDLATFSVLLDGELNVDDEMRQGGLNLYFDVIEDHPVLKDAGDQTKTFGGTIAITFDRNVDTEAKNINIDFQEFQVLDEGFLDDDSFYSDDTYAFARNADGSGRFHLALWGEFDDDGWSGPQTERMQLDARWDADEAGRARGRIEEVDGSGDLAHGDLEISECFGGDGILTWRTISEAYQAELPGYAFGDEATCIFTDTELDG